VAETEAGAAADPGSPWTDLDRPPLSVSRLRRALTGSAVWSDIRVLATTQSTNADVSRAAADGAAEGLVVFAEQQSAGRGRLDRRWESPPRAALLVSVLLRPPVPVVRTPLLPLLAGVAVAEALRTTAAVEAVLKWPNDVLVDGRKLAGVLVERTPDGAVVVGIGLNVTTRRSELPVPVATSVAMEGGSDREPLAKELLRALERRYVAFCAADGTPGSILPAYVAICETIGKRVTVEVPGGAVVDGVATSVDDHGMLVVRGDDGHERVWSAGDVTHVREG
jgi:BirA family biotin operon repressor/biotin-[acetyl-CoA-carboxylase] ligase